MFHHVASMYYIFTNFSKWLPRSTKKTKKTKKKKTCLDDTSLLLYIVFC